MRANPQADGARGRIGTVVEVACEGMTPKFSTASNVAESRGLTHPDGRFAEREKRPGAGQAFLELMAARREAHAAGGAALETGTRAKTTRCGQRKMSGGGNLGVSRGCQRGRRATGKVSTEALGLICRHLLLLVAWARARGGSGLDPVATATVARQGPVVAVFLGHGGRLGRRRIVGSRHHGQRVPPPGRILERHAAVGTRNRVGGPVYRHVSKGRKDCWSRARVVYTYKWASIFKSRMAAPLGKRAAALSPRE